MIVSNPGEFMPEEINVITAEAEPIADTTKIGNQEFIDQLLDELHGKQLWRKLDSLAESLQVDINDLRRWLDEAPGFLRKSGKEDGVYYYCWEDRYKKERPSKEEKKKQQRPAAREEDRYALAILHMTYWNLHRALKTYGLEISQQSSEAFNALTVAFDKLESGLVLFSKKSGADIEKLPKLS